MKKKNLFFQTAIKLMAFFLFASLLNLLSACEEPEKPVVDPPATNTTTPPTTPTTNLNKGEPNDQITNLTPYSSISNSDTFQVATTTDIDYYSVIDDIGAGRWDIYAVGINNLSSSDITLTLLNNDGSVIDSVICHPGQKTYINYASQSGPTSARKVKVTSTGSIVSPAIYKLIFGECGLNEYQEPNDIFEDASFIYQDTEYVGRIIKSTSGTYGDYDYIKLTIPARTMVYWKVTPGSGVTTLSYEQLNSNGVKVGNLNTGTSYYYDNTGSMTFFYFRMGGTVGPLGGSYTFQMTYLPCTGYIY